MASAAPLGGPFGQRIKMSIIDQYIENNESDLNELSYKKVNNTINLRIPNCNHQITLDEKQLQQLQNNELLHNIPGIQYFGNYGFNINTYGEYFLGSDGYSLYEIYGDVSHIDLRFKIGETYFEFNSVSPICRLLLEPYFASKAEYIADRGFYEYFYTLKIINLKLYDYKELIIKALFYLNSHYLKTTKKPLSVFQIIPEGYDENDFSNEAYAEKEKIISRTRILKRKDFINIEPLYFYTYACTQNAANQFLGFYRIIEFFFGRGTETEVKNCRFDKSITEKQLISLIQSKDERSQLKNLLKNVLNKSDITLLTNYLMHKGYLNDNSFGNFTNRIYEYRNSVVHAKENQIKDTKLPDIFGENDDYLSWNYLIKYIAEKCIQRINIK